MNKLFPLIFFMIFVSCSCVQYESDITYGMSSAVVGSPEVPFARIDNKPVKDSEGVPGSYMVTKPNNVDIVLEHDARPYKHKVKVRCNANTLDKDPILEKGDAFSYVLPHEEFGYLNFLYCEIYIQPQDRPETIAAFYRFFISLTKNNYEKRTAYKTDQGIFFGPAALYVNSGDETYIREPLCKDCKSGYSESYLMRYNYVR